MHKHIHLSNSTWPKSTSLLWNKNVFFPLLHSSLNCFKHGDRKLGRATKGKNSATFWPAGWYTTTDARAPESGGNETDFIILDCYFRHHILKVYVSFKSDHIIPHLFCNWNANYVSSNISYKLCAIYCFMFGVDKSKWIIIDTLKLS